MTCSFTVGETLSPWGVVKNTLRTGYIQCLLFNEDILTSVQLEAWVCTCLYTGGYVVVCMWSENKQHLHEINFPVSELMKTLNIHTAVLVKYAVLLNMEVINTIAGSQITSK